MTALSGGHRAKARYGLRHQQERFWAPEHCAGPMPRHRNCLAPELARAGFVGRCFRKTEERTFQDADAQSTVKPGKAAPVVTGYLRRRACRRNGYSWVPECCRVPQSETPLRWNFPDSPHSRLRTSANPARRRQNLARVRQSDQRVATMKPKHESQPRHLLVHLLRNELPPAVVQKESLLRLQWSFRRNAGWRPRKQSVAWAPSSFYY